MHIKRLVVFGDSLQDGGNLTQVLPLSHKACHDGFFSNGKVAVYHLKDKLSIHYNREIEIENFAIAAALVGSVNPNPLLTDKALPITDQIDRFENLYGRFSPDDVVVITGGGNNFFFSIIPEFPYLHLSNLYRVARDLATVVERVCQLGAKRILLSNIPDITSVPVFEFLPKGKRMKKITKRYFLQRMRQMVKHYYLRRLLKENLKLEKKINRIKVKYQYTECHLFDSFRFMRRVIQKPFDFGFENATDPCILSVGGFDLKGNIQSDSDILVKNNPETHLFWDLVHPTTKAHQLIANEWFKYLID